ncbi:MAG: DUF3341 domain-containing protein [Candidatus Eisenbacteria bacterium]|uniref:DUF3341 domain-containing protein n=1 Tax=Eiseniibacteriota bacterium TaxID=2212470 RepID=A0A956LZS1_UNCEI|nr:DUF3341 domain-containing protein [Candidatus Eisenbacteria bacterium]
MNVAPEQAGGREALFGYLVEFETVDQVLHAAAQVRDAGFTRWDVHTPFPVHGMDRAMGIRYTKLPLLVLTGGLTGMGLALLMQWWMNAYNYPYIISGKPFFSLPANIPVVFELTVLFSALTTVFGMLGLNQLPTWRHGVFSSERFARATDDRFFISVEASDPKFDPQRTAEFLGRLGGSEVEALQA